MSEQPAKYNQALDPTESGQKIAALANDLSFGLLRERGVSLPASCDGLVVSLEHSGFDDGQRDLLEIVPIGVSLEGIDLQHQAPGFHIKAQVAGIGHTRGSVSLDGIYEPASSKAEGLTFTEGAALAALQKFGAKNHDELIVRVRFELPPVNMSQ